MAEYIPILSLKNLISIFCSLLVYHTCAQPFCINGKIIDSATSLPLSGSNIYISNSTLRTIANKDGFYSLPRVLAGKYKILVSCVGYTTKIFDVSLVSEDKELNIFLPIKAVQLNEVKVSYTDWKKNLTSFKKEFIGTTFDNECKVLNPSVLNLSLNDNKLSANTDDFLDIENYVLGYKLRFLIKDFWADYNTGKCHYSGTVLFEQLASKKNQLVKWIKKRREVYQGSFRHFMVSLYANKLDEDKFMVRKLYEVPNSKRPSDSLINRKIKTFSLLLGHHGYKQVNDSLTKWRQLFQDKRTVESLAQEKVFASAIVKNTSFPEIKEIRFEDRLYIIYCNKTVNPDFDDLTRFKDASNFQISAIHIINFKQPIMFNRNGLLLNKENIFYEGAWNNRIIDLIPDDYDAQQ